MRQSRKFVPLVVAVVGFTGLYSQSAKAATFTVPGSSATIQGAINLASQGDTVLVSPGTYDEFVNINKANLILISTGGAAVTTIQRNVNNDTPIVDITASGVTLGGIGMGFTINQQDPGPAGVAHAGNCAVRVKGDVIGTSTVSIINNILNGNQVDEGLLVNPNITGGALIVDSNLFGKIGGAFGFKDAMHFHFSNPGGGLNHNVAANNATIQILNNQGTDINRGAIYFHASIFKSRITVQNNSFSGTASSDYGFYCANDIEDFSVCTIQGSTFSNFDYGVYISDETNHGSILSVLNCTVNGFRDDGLYLDYSYEGGTINVQGCLLNGNGTTAGYGIYTDTEYGSSTSISQCNISGVMDYGIYESYPEYGSSFSAIGNSIAMVPGSNGYGIYCETEYGSHTQIMNNTISGFDYAGIYEDYPEYGSTSTITGNMLTGHPNGADYGIYLYGPEYGSVLTCTGNTASNFDYAGIYNDYCYDGSELTIANNTLNALATTGADYGIYSDETYEQSTTLIDGNTCTGFTGYGIEIDYVYYDGRLVCSNNNLTAHPTGSDYGIYLYDVYEGAWATVINNNVLGFGNAGTDYGFYNDEVYDGATFVFHNNSFTAATGGAEYGFYSSSGFQDGTTNTISNNSFNGFTTYGMYIDYLAYDGSNSTVSGNTLTGHATGADEGIDIGSEVDYGCMGLISNNTISGVKDYGIYVSGVDDGSELRVVDNKITMIFPGASSQYGIYINDYADYGSLQEVSRNMVTGVGSAGQDGYGIYMEGITDGSRGFTNDNMLVETGTGTGYGIYTNYSADYGSSLEINRNTTSTYSNTGLYINDDTQEGGTLDVKHNLFHGSGYSIYYDPSYNVESGSTATFQGNTFSAFTVNGLHMGGFVWGARFNVLENKFQGAGAANGLFFNKQFDSAAEVTVFNNCFTGCTTGVRVLNILDTSFCNINQNDFAGTTTGIVNVMGDAGHRINGMANFFGGATPSTGEVDTSNFLGLPVDADSDGVEDCMDVCPGTALGAPVNADGCSFLQLNPTGSDSDNDGVGDDVDGCPSDPNKAAPGACGCGVPDTDLNGNGVPDCTEIGGGLGIPCGVCGPGAGAMLPLGVLGLVVAKRRRRRA